MNDITLEEAEFWNSYYNYNRFKEEIEHRDYEYVKFKTSKLRELIFKKRSNYKDCCLKEHLLLQKINNNEYCEFYNDLLDDLREELKKVQKEKQILEERYIKGDPIKLRNNFIEDLNNNN